MTLEMALYSCTRH